jgi:hypothetical protein
MPTEVPPIRPCSARTSISTIDLRRDEIDDDQRREQRNERAFPVDARNDQRGNQRADARAIDIERRDSAPPAALVKPALDEPSTIADMMLM